MIRLFYWLFHSHFYVHVETHPLGIITQKCLRCAKVRKVPLPKLEAL